MAQQLRILAAILEDLRLIPSTYIMAGSKPTVTPVPGESDTIFWPERALEAPWYTDIH